MENKKMKVLVEVECQEDKKDDCFYELLKLMNRNIPIAEGVFISKVYLQGFGVNTIVETLKKRMNDALDDIAKGL